VGRNDQQVTIRGYRVELGEVECALRDCRGVRDAVVVSPVREDGGRELVAYVVPAVARLADATLRRMLQRTLPPYMVPSAFNVVEALPLTASGKVDRMALLAGSSTAADRRPPAATRWQTPTEELVARLWSEVMPIAGADRGDGFLDLGGDSIMAMRLLGRVSDSFEVDISLEDLFSNATVPDLAEKIDARRTMVL
jgi:acyl carrier protein